MARSGRRSLRPRHDERLSSRRAEHTQGKPGAQLICPKPVFDSDRPQGESEPLEPRSPLKHAGCSRWVLRRREWHKHQIYRPYNWWRRGRNLRRQSSQSSVLQRWGARQLLFPVLDPAAKSRWSPSAARSSAYGGGHQRVHIYALSLRHPEAARCASTRPIV